MPLARDEAKEPGRAPMGGRWEMVSKSRTQTVLRVVKLTLANTGSSAALVRHNHELALSLRFAEEGVSSFGYEAQRLISETPLSRCFSSVRHQLDESRR